MPTLEKDIQTKIKKELTKQGWIVIRPVQVTKSGYPDLWCLKDGLLVFIEVKKPGEKPTELQEHRHNELRREGFEVMVFTSANDIDRICSVERPKL